MWKDISNFPFYEVSNTGQIRNKLSGIILVGSVNNSGYRIVELAREGRKYAFSVHRIVCTAFHSNNDNLPEVNHKDGIKLNNDESNLHWCTKEYNLEHARKLGLLSKHAGENHHLVKLTQEDVDFIRKNYKPRDKEFSGKALAKRFNVHKTTISHIVNGRNWK